MAKSIQLEKIESFYNFEKGIIIFDFTYSRSIKHVIVDLITMRVRDCHGNVFQYDSGKFICTNRRFLFYDKLEKCFECGSEIKEDTSSHHVWQIVYKCGCKISGAIGDETKIVRVEKKCK